jgi:hypothetical protein
MAWHTQLLLHWLLYWRLLLLLGWRRLLLLLHWRLLLLHWRPLLHGVGLELGAKRPTQPYSWQEHWYTGTWAST